MSLSIDIQAALPALRAEAEGRMISACTITRAGETTVDPETGLETPATTTIYTGICELQFKDDQALPVLADGQVLASQSPVLKLPVDADGSGAVEVDDIAEITGNPFDTSMIGLKVRIAGVHFKTFATARRFPVEAVSNRV